MSTKHEWQEEIPKKTVYQGITIPVYLDNDSIERLKPMHYERANWHINIGKSINIGKRGAQKAALKDFEKKLEAARLAYLDITNNNKARIDNFYGLTYFQECLENVSHCIENPLAEKSKYENLYYTISTSFPKKERTTRNAYKNTYFQTYMADVIRHVEGDYSKEFDTIVSRVTRAYKRIVLKQK